MALDAVVFPQDPFNHTTNKDLYNLLGGNWGYEEDHQDHHQDHQLQPSFDYPGYQTDQTYPNTYDYCSSHYSSPPSMVPHFNEMHIFNAISPTDHDQQSEFQLPLDHATVPSTTSTRAKRRRAKSRKNNEEIENQRIIHIAVERNRRKQMNEYLSLLRSLMPDSYVHKGDQASIIGGAINFVKELEQHAQFLGVLQKPSNCVPFSDFFTFPQYSARSGSTSSDDHGSPAEELPLLECKTSKASNIAADIEVAMVESHVSLKVRSKKLPKQLLKIVSGLEAVHLTVLHLNVVSADDVVLYSLSLKVEDECMLTSVDEIAAAVHEMLATIQHEAILNLN